MRGRGAYVAAIRRAKYVIENIPNSSENLRALQILKTCYRELDYLELEKDIDLIIAENFNISPSRKEEERPHFRARGSGGGRGRFFIIVEIFKKI